MSLIEREECPEHGWVSVVSSQPPGPIQRQCLCGKATVRVEYVPASQAVKAEREWCERILDVDQRDAGDGRLLAALANHATVRLHELEGQ